MARNPSPKRLKRSQGVLRVLSCLAKARERKKDPGTGVEREVYAFVPSDRVAETVGMQIHNARRVLRSLRKYGQAEIPAGQDLEYASGETRIGSPVPKKARYAYRITPRGLGRLEWLRENKPWRAE